MIRHVLCLLSAVVSVVAIPLDDYDCGSGYTAVPFNKPVIAKNEIWRLDGTTLFIDDQEQAGAMRCIFFDGVVFNSVNTANNIYQKMDKDDWWHSTGISWTEACPDPYYTGLRDSDQCGDGYCTSTGEVDAKNEFWRLDGTTLFIDDQEHSGAMRCIFFDGVVFNSVNTANNIYQRMDKDDWWHSTGISWTAACPAPHYTGLRDSDQCGDRYCTSTGEVDAKNEFWRLDGTTLFIDDQEHSGAMRCIFFDGVVFNAVNTANNIYQRMDKDDWWHSTGISWTAACPAPHYTGLRDSDQCTGPVYC